MNTLSVFDSYYNWTEDKKDVTFEEMQELIFGNKNTKPDDIPECIDEILRSSNISSILDYGAGLGRNLPILLSYSKHVDYADLENYRLKFGDYINNMEYEDKIYLGGLVLDNLSKDYDLIYASVVLQHIVDNDIYESIVKALAEKTRFLLIVQNVLTPVKYAILNGSFDIVRSETVSGVFNNHPHNFILYKAIR